MNRDLVDDLAVAIAAKLRAQMKFNALESERVENQAADEAAELTQNSFEEDDIEQLVERIMHAVDLSDEASEDFLASLLSTELSDTKVLDIANEITRLMSDSLENVFDEFPLEQVTIKP